MISNEIKPTDSQIDHAAKFAAAFVKTFEKELTTTGVPYSLIHAEYSKTTNFPMGNKAFAPILHLSGLEAVTKNGARCYIKLVHNLNS